MRSFFLFLVTLVTLVAFFATFVFIGGLTTGEWYGSAAATGASFAFFSLLLALWRET